MNEHDQFRELIEAYALGALDANERAALEAHLASGCPECAKALEEARLVVTQLAYLAPPAEPSEMLRARVLRSVRADAGSASGNGSQTMQVGPQRNSIPMWLWAGVAALLLVSLYSTWEARKMQQGVADMNQRAAAELKERKRLEDELTVAKHEAWILTDPNSKKIEIMPSDKNMPKIEAMWHPQMGIYVTAQKMPMPKNNKVLQLWLIPKTPGAKPMPSHVFWPDANGKIGEMVANPPEDMSETKALAVTEEPAGGSLQPTSTPLWVGGIS
ncbi:MAG TPA: anti-sigma factor [Candidatus Sulfotelmatobacter sp.]|nr:anti-sigma factor [Candidatus Sulfotelmatobacter sp.]